MLESRPRNARRLINPVNRVANGISVALKWVAGTGLTLSAMVTIILIGAIFFNALFDEAITIQPLSVPKMVSENGFTPEVVAVRLKDAMNDVVSVANTRMNHREILQQSELPDVVVPSVGLSVQTLATDIAKFLGLKERRLEISGEFTIDDGKLFLRLRDKGVLFFVSPAGVDRLKLTDLLNDAAQAVLNETQPYIVAAYWRSKGNLDRATAAANHIIAVFTMRDKQVLFAHNLKGLIAKDSGRRDEAIAEYKVAIALDPNEATPHYNLGVLLRSLGRWKEAITEYKTAIALDPKLAILHNGLGNVLRDMGHRDEAMTEYKAAIALDPTYASAHNGVGVLLNDMGRRNDAMTEYEAAITLDPKDAAPHYNLGDVLRGLGRQDDAITEYKAAIALDPTLKAPIPLVK